MPPVRRTILITASAFLLLFGTAAGCKSDHRSEVRLTNLHGDPINLLGPFDDFPAGRLAQNGERTVRLLPGNTPGNEYEFSAGRDGKVLASTSCTLEGAKYDDRGRQIGRNVRVVRWDGRTLTCIYGDEQKATAPPPTATSASGRPAPTSPPAVVITKVTAPPVVRTVAGGTPITIEWRGELPRLDPPARNLVLGTFVLTPVRCAPRDPCRPILGNIDAAYKNSATVPMLYCTIEKEGLNEYDLTIKDLLGHSSAPYHFTTQCNPR